jgi:hypothetical protein
MKFDLVDAVPVSVVGSQDRGIGVRLDRPALNLGAAGKLAEL